jgi:hypothetical protein
MYGWSKGWEGKSPKAGVRNIPNPPAICQHEQFNRISSVSPGDAVADVQQLEPEHDIYANCQ